jgi:hypothetical protein
MKEWTMRTSRWISAMAASAGFALLLTMGCASAPPAGTVYVADAPPALQVETVGVAPFADAVWVGGYWNWVSPNYVWVPGAWQRPPRAKAVWVAPVWRHHGRGWYRVDGHWR